MSFNDKLAYDDDDEAVRFSAALSVFHLEKQSWWVQGYRKAL